MVKVTGKCAHSVCVDCYRNLIYPKKCPLCRINFENEVDEEEEEEDETLAASEDDDDETYDSLEDVLNIPNTNDLGLDGIDGTRGGGL
jgi:hypothetical protein